jgi:hypothetical protein
VVAPRRPANPLEGAFWNFLRTAFPQDAPKQGTEYFRQLRMAFYAGSANSLGMDQGTLLCAHAAFLDEAKREAPAPQIVH